MADMNFLFTAQEQISEALESAEQSVGDLSGELSQLTGAFGIVNANVDGAEDELDSFKNSSQILRENTRKLGSEVRGLNNKFTELSASSNVTDAQIEEFSRSMQNVNQVSSVTRQALRETTKSFFELDSAADISESEIDALRSGLTGVGLAGLSAADNVQSINRALFAMHGAAQAAETEVSQVSRSLAIMSGSASGATPSLYALRQGLESVDEELQDVSSGAGKAAGSMSLLAAISETTAFEFGSLSVNIGPFNLALRNFLTQVPAILTGMGSMLAIVSSLIVAFATLATVTGLLVVGGALAFWEEFSAQFEEAGEAAEALGSALKELFTEALAPLMTEPNLDLFIGAIQGAANVVNRFAQFAAQMREEVLSSLGDVSGDIDDLFNAMRNSFLLLEPVVIGFINFMSQDLPVIMEIFASLTSEVDSDIGLLINGIGGLMSELLELAGVILTGITPVLLVLLEALTVAFFIFNSFNDGLTAMAIGLTVATLGILKLTSSLVGLTVWLNKATISMAEQAGTGTLLGAVYRNLIGAAMTYTTTNMTLRGAIWSVISGLYAKIAALKADKVAMLQNSLATSVLSTAKAGLITWLSAATTAMFGETVAAYIASAAMAVYSAVTWTAAAATSALATAVGILTSPITLVIIAVLALLGVLAQLAGFDVAGGIINFFKGILNAVQSVIDKVMELVGLGGDGGPGADMPGISDPDAIQTNPNVNLNFDEKTENNMDIKADPEEKGQLSRVVKDAMEEANSMERQKNGFTGN